MNFNDYKKLILEGKQEDAFVVYAGKFQPFHINHYRTYQYLVERFGKERVYIATADTPKKPKPGEHILDFKEKKEIITTMFKDIPADNVVHEQNVYNPKAIKSKFSEDTPYIAIVGKKDAERLSSGNYFSFLKDQEDDNLKGWSEKGYVELAPQQNIQYAGEVVTGTLIRDILSGTDEISKTEILSLIYTELDDYTVNFIKRKFKGVETKEEQMGMTQSSEEVDKNTSELSGSKTINVVTDKGKIVQRTVVPEDKL